MRRINTLPFPFLSPFVVLPSGAVKGGSVGSSKAGQPPTLSRADIEKLTRAGIPYRELVPVEVTPGMWIFEQPRPKHWVPRLAPSKIINTARKIACTPTVTAQQIMDDNSEQSMWQIRTENNINFDREVPVRPWPENGILTAIVKALRILREVRFSQPFPVLGTCDLYSWFREAQFTITGAVLSPGLGGIMWYPPGGPGSLWINATPHPDADRSRTMLLDRSTGIGILDLVALLIHERRHVEFLHNCGTNDDSIAYGGSWAFQYWFYLWLYDYSGAFLPEVIKPYYLGDADGVLERFTGCMGPRRP